MPALDDYRLLVESALVYNGFEWTYEQVRDDVAAGRAQAWYGPQSVVVTQLDDQPNGRTLHFFLAAGAMEEIERMTPPILDWGRGEGCTKARFVGRRGWTRSFLTRTGWTDTKLVIMEKPLDV